VWILFIFWFLTLHTLLCPCDREVGKTSFFRFFYVTLCTGTVRNANKNHKPPHPPMNNDQYRTRGKCLHPFMYVKTFFPWNLSLLYTVLKKTTRDEDFRLCFWHRIILFLTYDPEIGYIFLVLFHIYLLNIWQKRTVKL
jgi:hypothetical protein